MGRTHNIKGTKSTKNSGIMNARTKQSKNTTPIHKKKKVNRKKSKAARKARRKGR